MPALTTEGSSQYLTRDNVFNVGLLIGILALIAWFGLTADPTDRVRVWLITMVLMAAFGVIVGYGVTGYWRGILIDGRNKMSLSRLQILIWTLVILSALFTAILTNASLGWESPLDIVVPQQLWVLMGISTAAAVGTPLVLSNKASVKADDAEKAKAEQALEGQGFTDIDTNAAGTVVRNKQPTAARWGDLLKGDEFTNAASIDVGKLQMFFFTFVLAIGYCSAIATLFQTEGPVTSLPEVQEGMNVLLGISQTGYLAIKATPSTPAAPKPTGD